MSTTPARQQDYISLVRDNAKIFWNSYLTMLAAQEEWNAQNYSVELADGTGANEGILASEIGSVVFDSMNAVKTSVMDAGNATNITKLL